MELRVETGTLDFDIVNEKGRKLGHIEFIPTDFNIVNRYEKVVEALESFRFNDTENLTENTEELNKFETFIREQFDYLLGNNVSQEIFENCAALTTIANGDFYFENVMENIAKLINDVQGQRVKKKLAKVRKATARYHK